MPAAEELVRAPSRKPRSVAQVARQLDARAESNEKPAGARLFDRTHTDRLNSQATTPKTVTKEMQR